MRKRKEWIQLISKITIAVLLILYFFPSQVQVATSHDNYTTRQQASEIERILKECGIENYNITWAQENYYASNRGISEIYSIINSDGENYQLVLSVYNTERPKFVSLIKDMDTDIIIYEDEAEYIERQERANTQNLLTNALEEYSTEWNSYNNLMFVMQAFYVNDISVQEISVLTEIPFEVPDRFNDEEELLFLFILSNEGRGYIAVIPFPKIAPFALYDIENDTMLPQLRTTTSQNSNNIVWGSA